MFTMSMYSWILLLHVTTAILLIGNAIVGWHVRAAIGAASSPAAVGTLLDVFRRAAHASPLLAIIVLTTGVYLGSYGWWSQPWFAVAIGLWILQATLSAKGIRAHVSALSAAVHTGNATITPEAEAIRRSSSWLAISAVMRGNDFSLAYLMFNKPSLRESLALVLFTAILALLAEMGLERLRRVRRVAVHYTSA